MRSRNLLRGILGLWISVPSANAATDGGVEQRCIELGANCICSEPLQMTGFTQNVDKAFWNPTDSKSKECGQEVVGHPISRNAQDLIAQTDGTAMSRLPTGNSVVRFMSGPAGMSGTFFIGGDLSSGAIGAKYNARMAIRGYVYHSTDYNFRNETPACHSKFLQGTPGSWHWENHEGYIHQYDFCQANWGPASSSPDYVNCRRNVDDGPFPRDCCSGAPGATLQLKNADWKGHWFRFEDVVTNRSGPGLRHILYMKDITRGVAQVNGGAEFIAADWYGTDSGPDPWTTTFNKNITSSPRSLPVAVNFYREIGAGACNGWRGLSHLMIAGWDTDLGQRIGAAIEVEGDETPTGAPVPPSALKLTP